MFLFHQSLFSYRAKVVYQLLDIWKFTDSQFRETLSKIRFRSSYYNNNKNSSNTHITTRLHHSLHVIICHQMGIRLTNMAILRSTLPWLLEHVTSAIANPDLMEYDSCLSYCETGPSLDGISIGSTGNVKSFKNSMNRLVHFYAHIYLRWTHAAGFDSVYLKWRWWLRRYTPCTVTLTQTL